MSESPTRIVLIIVAACILLTMAALFRSGGGDEEPEAPGPRPGSFSASAQKARPNNQLARRDPDFGSSSHDIDRPRNLPSSGMTAPPRPGTLAGSEGPVADPAEAAKSLDAAVAGAAGRNLAAEPVPMAPLGSGLPGSGMPEVLDPEMAALFPGLPDDATFAVPFSGSGESLGAAIPLIDENVIYDVDQGAYFPPDARFAYADSGSVQNNAGTITFWMKPAWTADDPRNASLVQFRTDNWSNRLQIFKNGVYLRYLFTDNTGTETNISVDMSQPHHNPPWEPEVWHHIAITWGDALITMYADGKTVGQGTYLGELDVPTGTELYVGSDRAGGGPGADATLLRFVVADRVMGADEIQEMYATQHP